MIRDATRPISWVMAAQKAFRKFPAGAQERMLQALDLAAQGSMAGIAKPMRSLGSGIFEIALRHQTDAYRVVYAVQLADDIWVVHAFQKKATPKGEIDLIKSRIARLTEMLK